MEQLPSLIAAVPTTTTAPTTSESLKHSGEAGKPTKPTNHQPINKILAHKLI